MRDSKTLLIQKAKNNPNLQSLIDADMTLDDISKLNQPKWIKDGLIKIKEYKNYMDFEEYVLRNSKDSYVEDFIGDVGSWVLEETFLLFGKSEILIKTNDLFFITEKGIWLDTAFTNNIETKNRLMTQGKNIKSCKFSEYKTEIRKITNEKTV